MTSLGERAYEELLASGGFSLDPTGEPVPPGYYVSIEGYDRIIPLESVTPAAIDNWAHDVADALSGIVDAFLGGWLDRNTGDVYLDLSKRFDFQDEAIDFGQANHQMAIWDGFEQVEMRIASTDAPWKPQEPRTAAEMTNWVPDLGMDVPNLTRPLKASYKWLFHRPTNQLTWHKVSDDEDMPSDGWVPTHREIAKFHNLDWDGSWANARDWVSGYTDVFPESGNGKTTMFEEDKLNLAEKAIRERLNAMRIHQHEIVHADPLQGLIKP